jgi:hypothetical protein
LSDVDLKFGGLYELLLESSLSLLSNFYGFFSALLLGYFTLRNYGCDKISNYFLAVLKLGENCLFFYFDIPVLFGLSTSCNVAGVIVVLFD